MNRDRWVRRAQEVSDAFGLVLLLVLATYVLASLLDSSGWSAVVELSAGTVTAVVALSSAGTRISLVRVGALLGAVAIVLAAIAAISDTHGWLSAASLVEVGLLFAAAVAVLRRVVVSATVDTRTILGAISVYAILGLLFTFVYGTVERLQGEPLFGEVADPQNSDFIFFSFTTLTTTGYGDLVPVGQPGRMLAGLEMMIGQIFLVTLVARLVSLWRPRRGGQSPAGDAGPTA
jgi:Ion channel